MKVVLRALTEDEEILFEVGSIRVTVGRHSSNIVRIKDHHCSHNHCVFWIEGKKMFIEDAGSKNGTFVNGVRIQRNQVFIQDKITIGNCMITVSSSHNKPDIMKSLDFPGTVDDRTYIGISLQTQSKLDMVRLNPRMALEADRKVLGKRITHKILRPRGYEETMHHYKTWRQSWRHWLAVLIDISLTAVAFSIPFLVMLWLDNTLDDESSVADLISSSNLAIASVGSLLMGVLFRNFNVHARGGTVGERLTQLAKVPDEIRSKRD